MNTTIRYALALTCLIFFTPAFAKDFKVLEFNLEEIMAKSEVYKFYAERFKSEQEELEKKALKLQNNKKELSAIFKKQLSRNALYSMAINNLLVKVVKIIHAEHKKQGADVSIIRIASDSSPIRIKVRDIIITGKVTKKEVSVMAKRLALKVKLSEIMVSEKERKQIAKKLRKELDARA